MEFLLVFVHRYVDFRLPELDALLTLQDLAPEDCYDRTLIESKYRAHQCWEAQVKQDLKEVEQVDLSPFLKITLPSIQHATFLVARGILVKGVYQIWGEGLTYALLQKNVQLNLERQNFCALVNDPDCSWKVDVESFGKSLAMAEQAQRRDQLKEVFDQFRGPVQLKPEPDLPLLLIEEVGIRSQDVGQPPKVVYLCRQIAGMIRNRGRGGARDFVDLQSLKKRPYIGPTSLDAELALVMANMALVNPGSLVLDPFVGTASILVPCAQWGALCFGSDIDARILSGKAGKSPHTNFNAYALPRPELMKADLTQFPFRKPNNTHNDLPLGNTERTDLDEEGLFDAIVTDPPYGIRAGGRKSGNGQEDVRPVPEEFWGNHFPQTQSYHPRDVMADLLNFAARVLVNRGRLVYLLPTPYDFDMTLDCPQHPQLRLLSISEQPINSKYSRRLVTMEKLPRAQVKGLFAEGQEEHWTSFHCDRNFDKLERAL